MDDQRQYSVDRFEGDVAVLVDGEGHSALVPLSLLPPSVQCGDVLLERDGNYYCDLDATEINRNYALALQRKLRAKHKEE